MKKWRSTLCMGIILGMIVNLMDHFVENIPYVIIIPLQMVAIVLIFSGFIMRKIQKKNGEVKE